MGCAEKRPGGQVRKVDADMVREMRRMNRAGLNNREIAERLGVAASTVWTHLADHGIYSPASRLSQYTVYDRDGQVAAFGTAREASCRLESSGKDLGEPEQGRT